MFQFGTSRAQKAKVSVISRKRRFRRIDVSSARDVFFQNIVLDRAFTLSNGTFCFRATAR